MFYLIEIDLSNELLFLLNISGAESKNEAEIKTQNRTFRDKYHTFAFFPDIFQMSCQGTLLVPYCHDWAKAIAKEILLKHFNRGTSILIKLFHLI
jgi:hypothetical protein